MMTFIFENTTTVNSTNNLCVETIHATGDGFSYCIRPIARNDKEKLVKLFDQISPENRYLRFAHAISKLPDDFLEDVLDLDYKKEMAFVAIALEDNLEKIIGIARYVTKQSEEVCEFSITVADQYASHGVGMHLMTQLISYARMQKLKEMVGYILRTNTKMLKMVKELGFHSDANPNDTDFNVVTLSL